MDYKDTLPLSLVCCFVAISRRLGIPSTPLNTPQRVYACLLGTVVDVCEGRIEASLGITPEVQKLLFDEGIINNMSLAMANRSARNIRNAFRNTAPDVDNLRMGQLRNAIYATRCVFAHTSPASFHDAQWVEGGMVAAYFGVSTHRIDRQLPLTEFFTPGISNEFESEMQSLEARIMEDGGWQWHTPSIECRRLNLATQLFVGQIVRIREENTLGVVVGWLVSNFIFNIRPRCQNLSSSAAPK